MMGMVSATRLCRSWSLRLVVEWCRRVGVSFLCWVLRFSGSTAERLVVDLGVCHRSRPPPRRSLIRAY